MNSDVSDYLKSQESLISLPHCFAINKYPHEIIVQLSDQIGEKVQKFLKMSEIPTIISLSNGHIQRQGLRYETNSKEDIILSVLDFEAEKKIEEMGAVISRSGEELKGLQKPVSEYHLGLSHIYTRKQDYNSEFAGISNWSKRKEINKARD